MGFRSDMDKLNQRMRTNSPRAWIHPITFEVKSDVPPNGPVSLETLLPVLFEGYDRSVAHLAYSGFDLPRAEDVIPDLQPSPNAARIHIIFEGNDLTPDFQLCPSAVSIHMIFDGCYEGDDGLWFSVTYRVHGEGGDHLDDEDNPPDEDIQVIKKEVKRFATYAEAMQCYARYLVQVSAYLACPQPLLLMGIPS